MSRINQTDLEARVRAANAAFAKRRAKYRIVLGGRNGYMAIDQILAKDGSTHRNLFCGTTREVYTFLGGMLEAFSLSRRNAR